MNCLVFEYYERKIGLLDCLLRVLLKRADLDRLSSYNFFLGIYNLSGAGGTVRYNPTKECLPSHTSGNILFRCNRFAGK